MNTIEDLPSYNQTYNDYIDSISDGQLLIVPISNLDVIPETYKTIKDSSPNLIAILTGKACNYRRSERIKRETNNTTESFIVASERVLFYASKPLLLKVIISFFLYNKSKKKRMIIIVIFDSLQTIQK